jgi:hypothetical protein
VHNTKIISAFLKTFPVEISPKSEFQNFKLKKKTVIFKVFGRQK